MNICMIRYMTYHRLPASCMQHRLHFAGGAHHGKAQEKPGVRQNGGPHAEGPLLPAWQQR